MGAGTLAEIFGPNLVPADMQARLMGYTEKEYQAMFDQVSPDGAVGYSRWALGQSGYISPGTDNKPVFDPHFFDMLPHYQNYTYQKMGMD